MGTTPKPDPVKSCASCGQNLRRKRFNGRLEDMSAFARRKYCDFKCMGEGMTVESPTLGGIYQRAQREVPLGAKCQMCGTTEKLQRHHLDENPGNNAIENLMTLCGPCHTKWHWQHGKKAWKPANACSVCGEPVKGHGYCLKHYQRFKKHGDPLLVKRRGGLVRIC